MKRSRFVAAMVLLGMSACLVMIYVANAMTQNSRMTVVVRGLHEIGVAIHNRRDVDAGTWLPNSMKGRQTTDGWRYLLLPFLESVSDEFFQSAWKDGRYADYPHPVYCLTKHRNQRGEYTANCLAVVGSGTLAESDLTIFEEDAVLVLGVGDTDIGWGATGDLQVDQNGNLISMWPGPVYGKWIGVLFADGRVWLLDPSVPLEKLEGFFAVESAQRLDADQVLGPYRVYGRLFAD